MLEYLFNFIESNILLIFFGVLFFSISSIYSKKMKMLFITILIFSTLYFAFLCLYRLGIGIDILYYWSSKIIITIVEHIKSLFVFNLEHFIFVDHISNIVFRDQMINKFMIIFFFISSIIILPLVISLYKPLIIDLKCKIIKLNIKNNNFIKKYNYLKKQIPNLYMNCVLRC